MLPASSLLHSPANGLVSANSPSAVLETDLDCLWRVKGCILCRDLNLWSQPLLNSGQGSSEYWGICCQSCCALIRMSSPLVVPPFSSTSCCQRKRRFSRSGHFADRSRERAVSVDVSMASKRSDSDSETVDWLIVRPYWAWNHVIQAFWEGRGYCWSAQARRARRCDRRMRCFRGIFGISSNKRALRYLVYRILHGQVKRSDTIIALSSIWYRLKEA